MKIFVWLKEKNIKSQARLGSIVKFLVSTQEYEQGEVLCLFDGVRIGRLPCKEKKMPLLPVHTLESTFI